MAGALAGAGVSPNGATGFSLGVGALVGVGWQVAGGSGSN